MKGKLLVLIKHIACCALFLSFYPVVVLYSSVLYSYNSEAGQFLQLALLLLCGYAGYGMWAILSRLTAWPAVLLKLVFLVCAAIPAFVSCILLRQNMAGMLCGAVASILFYFVGGLLYFKKYQNIISKKNYIAAAVVNMAVLAVLYFFKFNYNVMAFIAVFLLLTAAYGITSNQSNLDFLMERRKHDLKHLPEKIRYYNIALSSVLLLIIIVGYLARNIVIKLIFLLGDLIKFLLIQMYQLLLFIAGLFGHGGNPSGNNDVRVQSESPFSNETSGNSFLLLYILVAFVIAAVIIFYRRQILNALRDLWLSYLKGMSKLMQWLKRRHPSGKADDGGSYYYDEEQMLSAEERKQILRAAQPGKSGMKVWKKKYKRFAQMKDSNKKFRFGYALVIEWLAIQGVAIEKSDTVTEILQKARASVQKLDYASETAEYNEIRYGEENLHSGSMQELSRTLCKLVHG